MANKKITELTEETSPAGADLLPLVDDVAGTPTTKKVTVTNLMTLAPVQTADISGFATQVSLGNHESLTSAVHGISAFGATLVDDADAAAARTTLGVDAAGTDNSTDVTLTGTPDYITLSGQEITVGQVDLSTDVTGSLPNSSVSGLGSLATSNNVEGEGGVVSTGETGGTKFLREDGDGTCSWQAPSVDVDTPLTTALRGTDNPHIGAYLNQSFKVTDNPDKSVMVIADADGNLDFLVKTNTASIYLNTPSARKAASFGFSVVEDSTEPDIEVTADNGEVYSVISGDSDTLSSSTLPFRQGFNLPDIGSYSAPLLISGGTIA